ncbi:MAG: SAM-dependent methyltransferase [Ruminococcaceae bacterium]|nr:SAM-dependent methyltransferase [Oscillospiraceae bacterium]
MIKLTKRLEAIKNHISVGANVIDVGTDHGYIPVYLAVNDIAESIIAADINSGPLSKARELAKEYDVTDKMSFVLTDGLNGIEPNADTIIIAGMGGETIISILEAAPWVRENGVKLILQPQSKISDLTLWLAENGFAVKSCELVCEREKYYIIMEVMAGEVVQEAFDPMYAEKLLLNAHDPILPEYLENLIRRQRHIVKGLEESKNCEQLEENKAVLAKLMELKGETEKW